MSFLAKLYLDYVEETGESGTEFNILTAEYSLNRPIDLHNRPNGRLRGGIIEITTESQYSNDLIGWVTNNELKNGLLEFNRRDSGSRSQRNIVFKNAYCIYIKEMFTSVGSSPMITKITISAHEMRVMGEAAVVNTWAGVEASESSSGSSESSGTTTSTTTGTEENTITFD